jgi:hypothetical protein
VIRGVATTVAVVACVTTVTTSIARADSGADRARAEALFEEGKTLRGEGRLPAACADFEESRRLDEGIGVTLYLADCYEQAGDVPRALLEFRNAEALAAARGDQRAAVARRRADALEPRATADRSVSDDGSKPVVAGSPAEARALPPPLGADAVPKSYANRRWIGVGIAGAGVIGIGVGATFGVIALSKLSRSNDGPCSPTDQCTSAGLTLRQQSADAATVSTIGFAAGAAVLAAGIAVYLSAPHDGGVTLAPMVSAGSAGALIRGRF